MRRALASFAFVASLLVASLLASRPASACSCMAAPPAREALEAADAVFEGRVVSIEDEGPMRAVTFEVVQYWKGADQERIVVRTGASSAACGIAFEVDTSWLIYAEQRPDGLGTGLCSRTRRIEEAENDLAVLEAGVVPVEITEADEVEGPAPVEPSRAGCGSCAVPTRRAPAPYATAILFAMLLSSCRSPSRRRAASPPPRGAAGTRCAP
ncbi:MAG: hypothetical protein AB7S26_23065 [Sandaracinaceae bacterium]